MVRRFGHWELDGVSVATNEVADDEDDWRNAENSKDTGDNATAPNAECEKDCRDASARNIRKQNSTVAAASHGNERGATTHD
jgi:hypothetical protein